MTDTSGAPWLKYQAAGASSADATPGPWSKYQTAKTTNPPPQEKSVSALPAYAQPVAAIGPDIAQEWQSGAKQVKQGEADLENPNADLAGRVMGGARALVGGAQQAGSFLTGTGRALVSDPIRNTKLPGSQFAANMADSAIGLVGPGAAGKVAEQVPRLARKAGEMAPIPSQMVRDISKPAAAELPATVTSADDMKRVAGHYYKQAAEQGGTLSPQYTDAIIDKIEKPLIRPEKIGAIAGEDDATSLAKSIRQHAGGKPLTLEEAQGLDEHMGDLIDKHFTVKGLDKVGKRIVDMQSQFRQSIEGAGAGDVVGGSNGFPSLQKGRQAWAQAAKMRDIEAITEGAQYADQPTTWVRNRIRTILTNKTKRRGFSDAEIAELEKVAKSGKVEGLLKAFGGRLTPYVAEAAGASMGGFPGLVAGAALGHGGSTLARNAAGALQGRKVTNLMDLLGSGAPPDAASILQQLGQSDAP